MWKRTFKVIFIIFGVTTWFMLLYLVVQLFWIAYGSFSTSAYDVSRRLTSPNYENTALLVRDYAFDLNFRLFIVEHGDDPAPNSLIDDALWSSRDYNLDSSINWHEDLEWSKDSSVIAVIIEGKYVFAYDFDVKKEYKDNGEIRQLLESHNKP